MAWRRAWTSARCVLVTEKLMVVRAINAAEKAILRGSTHENR